MMDGIRAWLLGVVFSSFAVGLANELIPKGRERALVRMVGGALMVLVLLRPVGTVTLESVSIPAGNLTQYADKQAQAYRTEQENELAAIIAERLETYIWDKATELGMNCSVHVAVSCGENGIPLPESVEIRAAYNSALAAWLEEVVGIPAEKQFWLEDSA